MSVPFRLLLERSVSISSSTFDLAAGGASISLNGASILFLLEPKFVNTFQALGGRR